MSFTERLRRCYDSHWMPRHRHPDYSALDATAEHPTADEIEIAQPLGLPDEMSDDEEISCDSNGRA